MNTFRVIGHKHLTTRTQAPCKSPGRIGLNQRNKYKHLDIYQEGSIFVETVMVESSEVISNPHRSCFILFGSYRDINILPANQM